MEPASFAPQLQHFAVRGLHGHRSVAIDMRDNTTLLVGLNGVGKTTVLNLLYLVLTQQWRRLSRYTFDALDLVFHEQSFTVTSEDIERGPQHVAWYRALRALMPARAARRLYEDPEFLNAVRHGSLSKQQLNYFSSKTRVPERILQRFLNQFRSTQPSFDFVDEPRSPLDELSDYLSNQVHVTVLYLPTFRRIEQELKDLFPDLDSRDARRRLGYPARSETDPSGNRRHLELVRFGMEDVTYNIDSTLRRLYEQMHSELNQLTGRYLRDIIRDQAKNVDTGAIRQLTDEDIARILARVEEHLLTESDKEDLRSVIDHIKKKGPGTLKTRHRYLASYFERLMALDARQIREEAPIRSFVDLTNEYFTDKHFVYDGTRYTLAARTDTGYEIELKDLSSGEKQVVSLFSHLLLTPSTQYFVLIDEPELSLSVEWQSRFLPDIVQSGRCAGLVAATHSPFIFDNDLEQFTVDLGACMD